MAYTDSDLLPMGSTWKLGQYSIRCFETTEAGVKYVLAHISGPEGNAQTGITLGSQDQVSGWYANANKTEITIYVSLSAGSFNAERGLVSLGGTILSTNNGSRSPMVKVNNGRAACAIASHANPDGHYGSGWFGVVSVSDSNSAALLGDNGPIATGSTTYKGHTVYACCVSTNENWGGGTIYTNPLGLPVYGGIIADTNVSINSEVVRQLCDFFGVYWESGGDKMVARFPINIRDAGGGPEGSDPSWGSDVDIWDEPGDVDYGWEPDEPTRTLYLMAQGATSGRHNDPIVDPSYTDIPTPKNTVKSDGNGGDGGNGGGGGAGAATLVTRPFGTGKAGNKEIILHARRHGYGSTGGKGGRAGDGCILIYYRTEDE